MNYLRKAQRNIIGGERGERGEKGERGDPRGPGPVWSLGHWSLGHSKDYDVPLRFSYILYLSKLLCYLLVLVIVYLLRNRSATLSRTSLK